MAQEQCSCRFCQQGLHQHCLSLTPEERVKPECKVEKGAGFRRRCQKHSWAQVLLIVLLGCFSPGAIQIPQTLAADVGIMPGSMPQPPQSEIPQLPWPPQNLRETAKAGKLSVLKEKMAPWALHWATAEGRTTLRMAAIGAAEAGQLDVLDYLCGKWKVPVHNLPTDEKVNSADTRLLAAVCGGKEDVALHLLFLAGSEEDLDLGRLIDSSGDTLLHNVAWRGQVQLFEVFLRRGACGAPMQFVAHDGHTVLSVAIEHFYFTVARVILDDYRARGKLQEAFEESFYDHGRKRFIPILHRLCNLRGKGLKTETESLAMAHFLIEQGAEVTVPNGWGQMPADLDSRFHQYLRDQLEKTKGEMEGGITIRAMWKCLVECLSVRVAWYLFCVLVVCRSALARGVLIYGRNSATLAAARDAEHKRAGAVRELASAREEAARKRAFEESWTVDEKQSSKKGERKKPVVARSSASEVPPAVTTLQ